MKKPVKNLVDLINNPKEIEKIVVENNTLEIKDIEISEKGEEDVPKEKETTGEKARVPRVVINIKEDHHQLIKLYSALTGNKLQDTIDEIFEEYIESNGLRKLNEQVKKIKKGS